MTSSIEAWVSGLKDRYGFMPKRIAKVIMLPAERISTQGLTKTDPIEQMARISKQENGKEQANTPRPKSKSKVLFGSPSSS
ncbi:MAG: hypothetical protein AAFR87_14415 [Bacteroidota bacterium]